MQRNPPIGPSEKRFRRNPSAVTTRSVSLSTSSTGGMTRGSGSSSGGTAMEQVCTPSQRLPSLSPQPASSTPPSSQQSPRDPCPSQRGPDSPCPSRQTLRSTSTRSDMQQPHE